MIEVKGHNITCALGTDSHHVFSSMYAGICGIKPHPNDEIGVVDDYMASTVDIDMPENQPQSPTTKLEKLAIHSIHDASSICDVNLASDNTIFILSSTKGNIELLDHHIDGIEPTRVYLPETARYIASTFKNKVAPVVVSNACISGLSALILAKRLLDNGRYEHAVVTGVDIITKFTVSGFQSFKALSSNRCRPFDSQRDGLNLGEAAATIILSKTAESTAGCWYLDEGSMHNDANHISGPSRVGEGSFRCLDDVTRDIDIRDIAMISTHGTATLYNDEMESIAIDRAGLSQIPVNAYKGYIGHTLGAAGILETIISMLSIDNGIILKTLGFETHGVSRSIDIVGGNRTTCRQCFIKMMSGFGGSNAAIRMRKEVKA